MAQKIIPASETNPHLTTFVQADSSSFKQVVQMLTGSSDLSPKNPQPSARNGPKRSAFKLSDRRHNSFKNLRINPLLPSDFSLRKHQHQAQEILSPSVLDFPALTLSPVTPLIPDPFNRSSHPNSEKAIAEKGFHLLPSPRNGAPRLLPLFPVSSSSSSSSSP